MKTVAALTMALTLALTGCFPNSAKHRTYAKLGEGAALAAGIGILYMVNSGADCDQMRTPGDDTSGCRGNATVYTTVGLGLILAGLSGFIATVSTSPEDKEPPANTLAPPAPIAPAPDAEKKTDTGAEKPAAPALKN